MLNRRQFLQTIAVAAVTPAASAATDDTTTDAGFGRLRPDPDGILDLPKNFSYQVISRHGENAVLSGIAMFESVTFSIACGQ